MPTIAKQPGGFGDAGKQLVGALLRVGEQPKQDLEQMQQHVIDGLQLKPAGELRAHKQSQPQPLTDSFQPQPLTDSFQPQPLTGIFQLQPGRPGMVGQHQHQHQQLADRLQQKLAAEEIHQEPELAHEASESQHVFDGFPPLAMQPPQHRLNPPQATIPQQHRVLLPPQPAMRQQDVIQARVELEPEPNQQQLLPISQQQSQRVPEGQRPVTVEERHQPVKVDAGRLLQAQIIPQQQHPGSQQHVAGHLTKREANSPWEEPETSNRLELHEQKATATVTVEQVASNRLELHEQKATPVGGGAGQGANNLQESHVAQLEPQAIAVSRINHEQVEGQDEAGAIPQETGEREVDDPSHAVIALPAKENGPGPNTSNTHAVEAMDAFGLGRNPPDTMMSDLGDQLKTIRIPASNGSQGSALPLGASGTMEDPPCEDHSSPAVQNEADMLPNFPQEEQHRPPEAVEAHSHHAMGENYPQTGDANTVTELDGTRVFAEKGDAASSQQGPTGGKRKRPISTPVAMAASACGIEANPVAMVMTGGPPRQRDPFEAVCATLQDEVDDAVIKVLQVCTPREEAVYPTRPPC